METGRGLTLSLVPAAVRLQAGAWVLTSGTGGEFPPNVPVGVIISSRQQDVALFQTALVQPAVDVEHVQDALVITDFVPINAPQAQ
jgi:cell shape-determining protein MreC